MGFTRETIRETECSFLRETVNAPRSSSSAPRPPPPVEMNEWLDKRFVHFTERDWKNRVSKMIRTSHHYFRLLLLLLWSLLFRFLQLSVPPLQRHQQAWGVYYSGFNPIRRVHVHANFSEPGSMCTQLKIRSVWKMNPESLNLDSMCTGP